MVAKGKLYIKRPVAKVRRKWFNITGLWRLEFTGEWGRAEDEERCSALLSPLRTMKLVS